MKILLLDYCSLVCEYWYSDHRRNDYTESGICKHDENYGCDVHCDEETFPRTCPLEDYIDYRKNKSIFDLTKISIELGKKENIKTTFV